MREFVNELTLKNFKFENNNYKINKNNDKQGLLLIYAPWCGYSKLLAPEWRKFENKYQDKYYIASLNSDKKNSGNNLIIEQIGVDGFPTIKYINKDGTVDINYDGDKNIEGFLKYLLEKL